MVSGFIPPFPNWISISFSGEFQCHTLGQVHRAFLTDKASDFADFPGAPVHPGQ